VVYHLNHFAFVGVDYETREIVVYDSVKGSSPPAAIVQSVVRFASEYGQDATNFGRRHEEGPYQTTAYDCGAFLFTRVGDGFMLLLSRLR
jgi:hypothetical protein